MKSFQVFARLNGKLARWECPAVDPADAIHHVTASIVAGSRRHPRVGAVLVLLETQPIDQPKETA
jgi:hypothetical protein